MMMHGKIFRTMNRVEYVAAAVDSFCRSSASALDLIHSIWPAHFALFSLSCSLVLNEQNTIN